MQLPKIGFAGEFTRFELIDRRGRVAKRIGGRKNLITNVGMNQLAEFPFALQAGGLRTHCAVGTSATVPTESTTALGNEIARTNTIISGGFVSTTIANGVRQIDITYEFDFNQANGNLTEVGVAPGAAAALFAVQQIKDGNGNPITLTKTSDFKLRVTHRLTINIGPTSPTNATPNITGIGERAGQYVIRAGAFWDIASDIMAGRSGPLSNILSAQYATGLNAVTYDGAVGLTLSGLTLGLPTIQYASYVNDSHERKMSLFSGTANANFTIKGVILYTAASNASGAAKESTSGWVFRFNDGQEITKDDEHNLTLDVLTLSWARA